MANGGGFQENLFGPAFLSEPDSYLCFGDDATMCDVPAEQAGSMLHAGDIDYDNRANFVPIFPSDLNFNASYYKSMATITAPAFQNTREAGMIPEVVTSLHILPPKINRPEIDHVLVQETPVVQNCSDALDETSNTIHTTGLTLPIRNRYATREEWERHRRLFTQLYRDENKTLKEVRSIMKDKYAFNATDKMYKKRINDWKLHKNCKVSDKEEILRCVEKSREMGVDLGEPMVNGRAIKMHLIERHRKEKRKAKYSSPSVIGNPCTKSTPPKPPISSSSISFSRIEDPGEYRNYENLLFQVDQYYNAKLENGPLEAWDAWELSSSRFQHVKISYDFQGGTYTCALSRKEDIFNRYVTAVSLLTHNHPREAWRMMQEGAEMVRPILLQEPPAFIRDLLTYLSWASPAAYDGLKMKLLRLISSMAIIVYGETHPISHMCQLLQTLHWNQDVIVLTMSKVRDVLRRQLGQTHRASIFAQQRLCSTLLEKRRYDEVERALLDLVHICERMYGRNNHHTRSCLYDMAMLYYLMWRDSEAEDIILDTLQRGKECGDCDYVNIMAKRMQSDIYTDQGDYEAAEASLWLALSGSLLHFGSRHPETLRTWSKYQNVTALLRKRQEGSYPLATYPEAFPKIPDKPLRRISLNRSSSQPPVDHREWGAGFCYEAPV